MVTDVLHVNYEQRDGWHVFKCPEAPGFYVLSRDLEKACTDIVLVLRCLLSLNGQRGPMPPVLIQMPDLGPPSTFGICADQVSLQVAASGDQTA